MITDDIEDIEKLVKAEPKDKKAEFHRNLKIGFTILGITTFALSALVNYYTLKRLIK